MNGHSERRALFGETDEVVGQKVAAALAAGLVPLVCVGETAAERAAGRTEAVVERQVRAALQDRSAEEIGRAWLAYEPVWAIGTGRTAAPVEAQAVHATLRAATEAPPKPEPARSVYKPITPLLGATLSEALAARPEADNRRARRAHRRMAQKR